MAEDGMTLPAQGAYILHVDDYLPLFRK